MQRSLATLVLWSAGAWAFAADPPRIPDSGPEADAFLAAASLRYHDMLGRLSASGKLDDDGPMLERARRVSKGLVAAAAQIRPTTATWSWEVHVTSDASVAAFCMAGGKVLVGAPFVKRLDLSDGELAMLLGHEIAHAVAGHRREASRQSMESDPAEEIREARIAVEQENEADEIGMGLAHSAGWPLSSLVGLYDKLAAEEGAGAFNSTHSPASARAAAARSMADKLGRQGPVRK